ncbi:MAG: c-type cytochrome [Alphaproteobacteria bacterium]|nr:c-type cytochrome [Alphaproteobacteria bacterium]
MDAIDRRWIEGFTLRRHRLRWPGFLVLASILLLTAPSAAQEEPQGRDEGESRRYNAGAPADPSKAWMLAQGGRIYDMWWGALLTDPPEETHPSYPSDGQLEGADTWRCVSCHGWDYKGKDGVNPAGPFKTSVRGIRDASGRPPEAIAKIVRGTIHGYTKEMIPDEAVALVATFVSAGQHDADAFIDRKSGKIRGDAERGRAVYQNLCAVCHDFDGRAEIFGEDMELKTLGAVANEHPWLALHKVMNGQPAADMPALRALDMQLALDALAYAQTLPRE